DRPWRRPYVEGRLGAGKDRSARSVFYRPQALSERRLLFRYHAEGDGFPDFDVHRALRGCTHRRLDQPMERDDRRSAAEDRAPTSTLHWRHTARLRADGEAEVSAHLLVVWRADADSVRPFISLVCPPSLPHRRQHDIGRANARRGAHGHDRV